MQAITISDLYLLAGIIGRHRDWHLREQCKASLHPCVLAMMSHGAPLDWHLLVLEWPHVSKTDVLKLAYVRSEEYGKAERKLLLATGKYLKRHWPRVRDDVIRDVVLQYETRIKGHIAFLPDETEQYVRAVQQGPNSCMKWDHASACPEGHPYWAYAAEMGWRMAVRYNTHDQICARAMVYEPQKAFVRSFRACDDDPSSTGYSHADERLEAWLKGQGYTHFSEWPAGTKLKYIPRDNDCGFLAPYIDGDAQCVDVYSRSGYLEIVESGEFTCTNTDGDAEGSSGESCHHCGGRHDEDDGRWLERYDRWVCDEHLGLYYTWISHIEEYVLDDEVITATDGEKLDGQNIPDGYTLLDYGQYEGRYAPEDYVVYDHYGDSWHLEDLDDGDLIRFDEDSRLSGEYMDRTDSRVLELEDDDGDIRYFHERDVGSVIHKVTHGDREGEYVLDEDCYRNTRMRFVWHTDDLITTPEDLDGEDPENKCVMLCAVSEEADNYYPAEIATYIPELGWFKDDELERHTINRDAAPVTNSTVSI